MNFKIFDNNQPTSRLEGLSLEGCYFSDTSEVHIHLLTDNLIEQFSSYQLDLDHKNIAIGPEISSDKIAELVLLGIDEYIPSSTDKIILQAYLRNVCKRIKANRSINQDIRVLNKHLTYLPKTMKLVTSDKKIVSLSQVENTIFSLFLENKNKVISKEKLREDLHLQVDMQTDKSLDSAIHRLKTKIKTANNQINLIKTLYGSGYIFTS